MKSIGEGNLQQSHSVVQIGLAHHYRMLPVFVGDDKCQSSHLRPIIELEQVAKWFHACIVEHNVLIEYRRGNLD